MTINWPFLALTTFLLKRHEKIQSKLSYQELGDCNFFPQGTEEYFKKAGSTRALIPAGE